MLPKHQSRTITCSCSTALFTYLGYLKKTVLSKHEDLIESTVKHVGEKKQKSLKADHRRSFWISLSKCSSSAPYLQRLLPFDFIQKLFQFPVLLFLVSRIPMTWELVAEM